MSLAEIKEALSQLKNGPHDHEEWQLLMKSVDPADIPSVVDPNEAANLIVWNTCSGADNARGKGDKKMCVFLSFLLFSSLS